MSYSYVATAFDHRGRKAGSWTSASVKGAMALADSHAHPSYRVGVRAAFTSDGSFQGEGRGREMAYREHGRWLVESFHDQSTESPPKNLVLGHRSRDRLRRRSRSVDRGASREFYEFNRKVRGAATRLGWSVVKDENVIPLGDRMFQVVVHDSRTRTGMKTVRIRIPKHLYQDA